MKITKEEIEISTNSNYKLKPLPREIEGLLVIKDLGRTATGVNRKAQFKCHCGNLFIASINHIKAKTTKGCGCSKGKNFKLMNIAPKMLECLKELSDSILKHHRTLKMPEQEDLYFAIHKAKDLIKLIKKSAE